MVDNRVTKNHISPKTVKQLKMSYKQKEDLYPLVTISKDPIIYGDEIIHLKMGLVELELEKRHIIMSFNVLPLGKDKAVLRMPFLQEYNPKIDWITGDVKL